MPVKTIVRCVLATLLTSTLVTAAFSDEPAIVSKVGGRDVSWQHGDKTSAPKVQTLLNAGDRVAAGKGSFLEIEYLADNCKIRVAAGSSAVIGDSSHCAAAAQKAEAAPADAKVIPAATGAVEVSDKKGPVTRVNRGDGMVDASVGDSLKVGDEVFAGADSSVTLYFAFPQCSFTVPAGTVYKIVEQAPCKGGAAANDGAAGAIEAPAATVPTGVIVGAGVVVVGGAAIAVIATTGDDNNNNNNPATPD